MKKSDITKDIIKRLNDLEELESRLFLNKMSTKLLDRVYKSGLELASIITSRKRLENEALMSYLIWLDRVNWLLDTTKLDFEMRKIEVEMFGKPL